MKYSIKSIAGSLVALVLVGIQFVPVDRTNPPVEREINWDSDTTRQIATRACFDCHSNQTVWPWYAYLAPLSWRVAEHVEHGREHLNFSNWNQPNEDLDEIKEVLEEGEMPLWDYLLMHSEARLSEEEQATLLQGLEQTFEMDPPVERQRQRPPPGQ